MIKPYYLHERRRHQRVSCDQPVQVRCGVTGRYVLGHTVDISEGGCLLRLERPIAVQPGQSLRLSIAHRSLQSFLLGDDILDCRVVRRHGHDFTQLLAVSFEDSLVLAQAG